MLLLSLRTRQARAILLLQKNHTRRARCPHPRAIGATFRIDEYRSRIEAMQEEFEHLSEERRRELAGHIKSMPSPPRA